MTLVGVFKILLSRDDDEVEQTLQNFFCKMFLVGRAVCFILAILFTIIAVITNSQYSTRKIPPPKPFFTGQTWVEDFYEGELYYALLKATKYDVIFLMLYAPWDADSQNARSEFETACRYFHKKVYCAAVNCWHANAGCKAFFDNIVMYPMFLVDLHNIPSIRYNGEIVASHMIRFLSTVMKPLERMCSVEKFHTLRYTCDALIVSFLPDYNWYKRYYTASLRILEYDPRREVCWSFITDSNVAQSLDMKAFSMKMYLWNETKEFNDSFSSKNIIRWVRENVQMLTQWIFFKNARSNRLADLVQFNPAVILFTPRNMYLDYVPSYLLFKESVMEFKNCFIDLNMSQRRKYIAEKRKKIIDDHKYWKKVCNTKFNLQAKNYNSKILNIINQNYNKYTFKSVNILSNVTETKYIHQTNSASRKITLDGYNFTLNSNDDDQSPQNLVLLHIREKCRQINMLKKTYEYTFLSLEFEDQVDDLVPNSLCRLNNTYSFFAVDSLLYSHFAAALGINLDNYKDRTTIVIFDNTNEEAFVLPVGFEEKSAMHELMMNSTNHIISRWMKSTEDSLIYINRYNKSNNVMTDETCVLELNSGSFQSVVFNLTQHVIVYYYTPYCSYCQVSAYTFLSVAHMLKNFSQVTFARIDGENNDLPWYLVPQSYPTIILFPAKRKSESVAFPPSRELTVENLLDFVLSNVDVEIKLRYMIAECDKYKHMEYKAQEAMFNQCIISVKTYCLGLINNLVKKYKDTTVADNNKTNGSIILTAMVDRLKYLKSIYFNLDSLCKV